MSTTLENNPAQDPAAGEAPVARLCRACSAPMLEGQDWCLSCGTAAPGRLGGSPGWKAVNSVAALTLVLIVGAVAAAYAALSGDASSEAGKTPPASATPIPGQLAQIPDAPPSATAPGAAPPTTPGGIPGVPSIVPGGAGTSTGKVTSPGASALPFTPPMPSSVQPAAPNPGAQTPPSTGNTGSTGDDDTDGSGDGEASGGSSDGGGGGGKTPRKPVTLADIELGEKALDIYEPNKRVVRSGTLTNAHDGNEKTAWSVTTTDDGFPMQVGLLVDLEKARNVKEIELGTSTPGGRIEVYGAVGSALPPDILDTRWEHVASRSRVDETDTLGNVKGDGTERIRFPGPGATGGRFRYVLLWFTTPPDDGPTVRVTELGLRG